MQQKFANFDLLSFAR